MSIPIPTLTRTELLILMMVVVVLATVAYAEFPPTVVSESRCLLQQVQMRQGGMEVVLLEHGIHRGEADSLIELTHKNIETFWGGELSTVRAGPSDAILLWKRVNIYGLVAMTVNLQPPYNFCTFTPRGDQETRIIAR
ncbi:MAG: hypothetical protein JSV66_02075 [Trueperaceae bacterium]|nr:MAG: hypothetical protein JSV66_02075 [Trueperaceae bacterium]